MTRIQQSEQDTSNKTLVADKGYNLEKMESSVEGQKNDTVSQDTAKIDESSSHKYPLDSSAVPEYSLYSLEHCLCI